MNVSIGVTNRARCIPYSYKGSPGHIYMAWRSKCCMVPVILLQPPRTTTGSGWRCIKCGGVLERADQFEGAPEGDEFTNMLEIMAQ